MSATPCHDEPAATLAAECCASVAAGTPAAAAELATVPQPVLAAEGGAIVFGSTAPEAELARAARRPASPPGHVPLFTLHSALLI